MLSSRLCSKILCSVWGFVYSSSVLIKSFWRPLVYVFRVRTTMCRRLWGLDVSSTLSRRAILYFRPYKQLPRHSLLFSSRWCSLQFRPAKLNLKKRSLFRSRLPATQPTIDFNCLSFLGLAFSCFILDQKFIGCFTEMLLKFSRKKSSWTLFCCSEIITNSRDLPMTWLLTSIICLAICNVTLQSSAWQLKRAVLLRCFFLSSLIYPSISLYRIRRETLDTTTENDFSSYHLSTRRVQVEPTFSRILESWGNSRRPRRFLGATIAKRRIYAAEYRDANAKVLLLIMTIFAESTFHSLNCSYRSVNFIIGCNFYDVRIHAGK